MENAVILEQELTKATSNAKNTDKENPKSKECEAYIFFLNL